MNTFPGEVLYNILTHLPPDHMLLVNKHINSLHNELYYKEILENYHHNLKPFSTWKDLYLRFKEEGDVYFNNSGSLSCRYIRGIKCFGYVPLLDGGVTSSVLLLRFNGDLFLINVFDGKAEIIDDRVSDICSSGYIKAHKFYGLFNQHSQTNIQTSIQLLAESTDDFLFISGENGMYTCAATLTKVYIYANKSNSDQKCLSKSFDFKIKAIETTCLGAVDVLLETGEMIVLNSKLSEINIISDVLNINTRFIQTTKRYLLLPMLLQPIDYLREEANVKDFLDGSVKLSLDSWDEVVKCFLIMNHHFILDKQVLFSVKDGSTHKIETNFKIKYICGKSGKYWIC
jgi:hypothetical protein